MFSPRRTKSLDSTTSSNGSMTSDKLSPKHKGRVYVSTCGKIRRCIILGVMGFVGVVVLQKVYSPNGSSTSSNKSVTADAYERPKALPVATAVAATALDPSAAPTPAPTPARITTTKLQRLTIADIPVLLQHPPNLTEPMGLLFVAHGCSHSATDFWPSTGDLAQQEEAAKGSGSEDEAPESQEHHHEGDVDRESPEEQDSPEGKSSEDDKEEERHQHQATQQPVGGVGGAAELGGGAAQQQTVQQLQQQQVQQQPNPAGGGGVAVGDLEVGGTETTEEAADGDAGGETVSQQQQMIQQPDPQQQQMVQEQQQIMVQRQVQPEQEQMQQQPAAADAVVANGDLEVGGTEMTEDEEPAERRWMRMRRRLEDEPEEDLGGEDEDEDPRQQRIKNRDKRNKKKNQNPFFQAALAKKEAAKLKKKTASVAKDDPNNICPECLGLPEERAIIDMARHEFGFTVVAISSIDRDSKCWTPPDSVRVAKVLAEINDRWDLQQKPMFAFGASSGGGFVGSGLVQAMIQLKRPLDGYIAQIASPNPLKMDLGSGVTTTGRTNERRNIPPAVYIPMTRDEAMLAKVDKIVEKMKKELNYEFAAKSIPVHPLSVTDEFFQHRVPDNTYSFEESEKMVHTLLDSHVLRDTYSAVTSKHKRLVRHDPRKSSWRHLIRPLVKPPDLLKANRSAISELMNVAYGMHELTREGVREGLQWLMEAHQEEQANQF